KPPADKRPRKLTKDRYPTLSSQKEALFNRGTRNVIAPKPADTEAVSAPQDTESSSSSASGSSSDQKGKAPGNAKAAKPRRKNKATQGGKVAKGLTSLMNTARKSQSKPRNQNGKQASK
ncbi:MAG: hypothetical protein M1825_000858, partial [Sarcosagium campestre]